MCNMLLWKGCFHSYQDDVVFCSIFKHCYEWIVKKFLLSVLFWFVAPVMAADWGYTGAGAAKWGDLNEYAACKAGAEQSPINIAEYMSGLAATQRDIC